jgi:heterodisulfide reductase subunit B
MEYTYYPGCTLKGSATDLDESFRAAAETLGIRLTELPDWTCCGASSAHMVDAYLEDALSAGDLVTAEGMGKDVVAPCAACHIRMKHSAGKLMEDKDLQSQYPFQGKIKILSGLEMFSSDKVLADLKSKVAKPLEGLRVVPYYGCLAVRPPEVAEPDDIENPMQMDRILETIGAEVVKWPYKTDCCGGSLSLTRTDLVMKLSQKLLDMAELVDADAMVTMCPMCQANLDTRQEDISNATGKRYSMPIVYVTELIGMALGNGNARSWLDKHIVAPHETLRKRGAL